MHTEQAIYGTGKLLRSLFLEGTQIITLSLQSEDNNDRNSKYGEQLAKENFRFQSVAIRGDTAFGSGHGFNVADNATGIE